jgi:phosphate/sulfate permease
MNQKQINAKPKSVARLIIGAIIIGAVANSLRRPDAWGRDSTEAIIFLLLNLSIAGVGVWMIVSYLKKPRR